MNSIKLISWNLIFIFVLSSCEKKVGIGPQQKQTIDSIPTVSVDTTKNLVLISNEGNFTFNNASLTLYDKVNKTTNNGVFQTKNNTLLGDVFQSLKYINNELFLVINNSNKIEILDEQLLSKGQINGLVSPRYIENISSGKSYVSSFKSGFLYEINENTQQITTLIPLSGWTEKMIHFNKQLFVANMDSSRLFVINTDNNLITDTINVGKQPNSIILDKNNHIWVLCDGGFKEELPTLWEIDATNRQIIKTLSFSDINDSPSRMLYNSATDKLLFLNAGVFEFYISDNTLPTDPIINGSNHLFYGLGLDPITQETYVSDAIDFVQSGNVFRYNTQNQLVDSFATGIIPGDFLFFGE